MKTHFPQNRERLLLSHKNRRVLRIIHYHRYYRYSFEIKPVEKSYYDKKKKIYGIIFIVLFIIWIPLSYLTFGHTISNVLMMIYLSLLLRFGIKESIWEGFFPFLKLNNKGIFFRDFHIKWEQVVRVKAKIKIYGVVIYIFTKQGKIVKPLDTENSVISWEILNNVISFKKKYRKPYVYNKKYNPL